MIMSRQQTCCTSSVMDSRPHLFDNPPLPSQFLHRRQIMLLGDRGIMMRRNCLRLSRSSATCDGVDHLIARPTTYRCAATPHGAMEHQENLLSFRASQFDVALKRAISTPYERSHKFPGSCLTPSRNPTF